MIGPLGVLRTESWQKTEVEKNHCDISPQDSWYIGCDGEKKKLTAPQTSFKVQWRRSQQACFIKVKHPQNTSKIISDLITTSMHLHALAKFPWNKVVEALTSQQTGWNNKSNQNTLLSVSSLTSHNNLLFKALIQEDFLKSLTLSR